MAEHCTQCDGTGKVKQHVGNKLTGVKVTCLHCAGTGIEPETKPTFQKRHIIGSLYTYPTMKRDAVVLVGFIILLFIFRLAGS